MNIKYIVLTCEKYLNTRAESIKKTWGKDKDLIFLSDKNGSNNIISFDNLSSSYSDMWQRYYEFIRQIDIDNEWVLFADDDTYINISNLNKLINTLNHEDSIYIGKKLFLSEIATDFDGQYTGFPLNSLIGEGAYLPLEYASGGAGFLLSKKSYKTIRNYLLQLNSPARAYNTDVAFGMWIRNCNINITNNIKFNSNNPIKLCHSKNEILDSITYHYVNERLMLSLHEFINENV